MKPSMTDSTPAATKAETHPTGHGFWDRLVDDLHKRPRHYVNRVLLAAIIIVVPVLGIRFWNASRESKEGDLAVRWYESTVSSTPAKERAPALEELAPRTKDTSFEAQRLYDLAAAYKEVADAATTQEEKVLNYQKAIDTVSELERSFPNSFW